MPRAHADAGADRGDLQPGQPVRRLHRHAAGRFRRARRHASRAEEGLPADQHHPRRRSSRPQSVAQGELPKRRWRRPKTWSRPMSPPASARSISMPRWAAPASRPRSTTRRPPRAPRAWHGVAERRGGSAGGELPLYVIGTEVPPPGGADHAHQPTSNRPSPAAARRTIDDPSRGLRRGRPGRRLFAGHRSRRPARRRVRQRERHLLRSRQGAASDADLLDDEPASSTRRIRPTIRAGGACAQLVEDGFAILKVGPELTFVLREALYGLDLIASDLLPGLWRAAALLARWKR